MKHLWTLLCDVAGWIFVLGVGIFWVYRSYLRTDDRPALVKRWIISGALLLLMVAIVWTGSPLAPLFIAIPAVFLGLLWAPTIGHMLANPLTSAIDGGEIEVDPKPFYFTAEGKRRKGLYAEAMADVRIQLEKFPGDFEGYMKLASIQMENLKNFPAAEATLDEFLSLPDRPPNEQVSALHLLADWQLQYGRNAGAAGGSLQRIVQLYPGTPFSHAAEQRIAHLGAADETSRARHERKFTVTPGQRDLGLTSEGEPVPIQKDSPDGVAALLKQLELHPTDTEAREKLATVYSEQFQRVDLAAEQLEQLIALPNETPRHIAHWLNLLATMQIKQARNLEAARNALQRIVERFPGGALAELAQSRLTNLPSELKAGEQTAGKTLGTYEKNIGLRKSTG